MANEIQKQDNNIADVLKMEITPAVISFPGEKELRAYLDAEMKKYKSLVITDENISDAKKAKTYLNKMKKALNDARIQKEREVMQPFNEFKASIETLIKQLDETIDPIDQKIKEADVLAREQKKEKIKKEIMEIIDGHGITEEEAGFFEIEPKWLNKTAKMKDIRESLVMQARSYLQQKKEYEDGVKLIHNLSETLDVTEDNYIELFKDGMSIDDVLAFMKREKENRDRLRAEEERKRQEEELQKAQEEQTKQEEQTDPDFDYLAGVDPKEYQGEKSDVQFDLAGLKGFDFETGEVFENDLPDIESDVQTVTLKLSGTYENLERLNNVMQDLGISFELIDLANDYIRIR